MQGDRKQGLCCSGLQRNSLLDQGSLQPAALQLLTVPPVSRFVGSVSEQCERGAFTPSHSVTAEAGALPVKRASSACFLSALHSGKDNGLAA